jgi:hypothetical protein
MALFVLLNLAREILDLIYESYCSLDGGYTVNLETGELRATNTALRKECLALGYTCKRVANETNGFALMNNALVFRPVEVDQALGYKCEQLVGYWKYKLEESFHVAAKDSLITKSIQQKVAERPPDFESVIESMMHPDW